MIMILFGNILTLKISKSLLGFDLKIVGVFKI